MQVTLYVTFFTEDGGVRRDICCIPAYVDCWTNNNPFVELWAKKQVTLGQILEFQQTLPGHDWRFEHLDSVAAILSCCPSVPVYFSNL